MQHPPIDITGAEASRQDVRRDDSELSDPYAQLADRFLAHYATLRGAVRAELVARQLAEHLPAVPGPIADVGGGAGQQAIRLARHGYRVTLLDPSSEMLARARVAVAAAEPEVRRRVAIVQWSGEEAANVLEAESFAGVLCHGVLPYVEDPRPLLSAVARLPHRGGLVSVLAKNAEALAMRPALERRFGEALVAFTADRDRGGLGVPTRADSVEALVRLLDDVAVDVETWYGVRVFTDHLGDEPPGVDFREVLAVEWEAGRRDPYRRLARLIHVIGRRR